MATATAPAPARRRRSANAARSARKIGLGLLGILGMLATWQLIPTLGIVSPQYLPYATDTLANLFGEMRDLEFWRNVGRTLSLWGTGLAIATVAAIVLGTLVGLSRFLRKATHTTVEFLRPIPSVALIPVAILIFGLQPQAGLVIIVYATFWQVFVQVLYGVADIEEALRISGLATANMTTDCANTTNGTSVGTRRLRQSPRAIPPRPSNWWSLIRLLVGPTAWLGRLRSNSLCVWHKVWSWTTAGAQGATSPWSW